MGLLDGLKKVAKLTPEGRVLDAASKATGEPSAEAGFFGQMDAEAPARAPEQSLRDKYRGRINNWWEKRKADKEMSASIDRFNTSQQGAKEVDQAQQPQQPAPQAQPQYQTPQLPGESKKSNPWKWIVGSGVVVFILYIILATPLGSGFQSKIVEGGLGVKTGLRTGVLNTAFETLFLGKNPLEGVQQSEKVVSEEKKDVGLRIDSVKPVRTEGYTSPSKIEVEGYLSAVSATDDEVTLSVKGNVEPILLSGLGITGESLACQIEGTDYAGQKVRSRDISNRYFKCTSPTVYAAGTLAGETAGTVKTIPIKIEATLSGATTQTKKIVYFASPDALRTKHSAKDFGIDPKLLIPDQDGDTAVNLGVGIAGDEKHERIISTDAGNTLSEYLLSASVQNPTFSTGRATINNLVLFVGSNAAIIGQNTAGGLVSEDFICNPTESSSQTRQKWIACSPRPELGIQELKPGDAQVFALRFKVPNAALSGKTLASFEALAKLQFTYVTPRDVAVTIKTR
jgi:hypothetical protein